MSFGRPLGRVIRYSCAIGTTGTLTPASAPISPANMPPAFTTISVSIVPRSVSTRGDPAALDADPRRPRPRLRSRRRAGGRPRRARRSAGSGRCSRRWGCTRRRARRRSTSAERARCASAAETSSSPSPNVFAQPACRAISSIRSSDDASRSEPTSCQPVSSSTSAPSVRYSSTELIIIFVRLIEPRSCPTRPAEWKVEPLVRSARSTRTASAHPRRASQ